MPNPRAPMSNPRAGGNSAIQLPPQPRTVSYYDDKGQIRLDLLDGEAQKLAEELARTELKSTQLRRYYHEVVNLQRRLDQLAAGSSREQAFECLRADFKLLKAKAHYANRRSKNMFPDRLLQFFVDHTHAVKTVQDFDAFCRHFEAVVGFFQYMKRED
jgi:CRISPR-associated protein Csm2